jgi:hypothetical protein
MRTVELLELIVQKFLELHVVSNRNSGENVG